MLNFSKNNNSVFVISGPAGVGKTTLAKMLLEEFEGGIKKSCSFTTRKPRLKEKSGLDYFFVEEEEFKRKLLNQDFLEYTYIFTSYYGTDKNNVKEIFLENKHVLLILDTLGAKQIKKIMPAVLIFIAPPSIEEQRKRLFHRNTETKKDINIRTSQTKKELSDSVFFDYYLVNDEIKTSYEILRSIIIAETHKRKNDEEKELVNQ